MMIKSKMLYKWFILVISILIKVSFLSQVNAGPIEDFERFISSTMALKTEFNQFTVSSEGKITEEVSGVFTLSRPGRFIWEYLEPYKQIIVSDGKKIWFYDIDLEQVVEKKIDKVFDITPTALLLEKKSLDEQYIMDVVVHNNKDWLELRSLKEDNFIRKIFIIFDDIYIKEMVIEDHFNNRTTIYFKNHKFMKKISKNYFKFKRPENVDYLIE